MQTIDVVCGNCGSKLVAKERIAGKTVPCPKCDNPVLVPPIDIPLKPSRTRRATERQKEYAKSLGIDFPADIDRAAISELIDATLDRRDEERYRRLDELQDRESAVREQLRQEILAEVDDEDPRLSKAEPGQVADAFGERGMGTIVVTFDPNEIEDFEHLLGVNFNVSFSSDYMDIEDVASVLFELGYGLKHDRK